MLAIAAAALVVSAAPGRAFAQAGSGAERYEVTITPPKRPGSEPPAVEAAPATEGTAPSAASGEAAPVAPGGADAAKAASTATAAPPAPAAAKPAANLPLRTLQVGAYRQRSRAEQLHEALSPTFQDVEIVEVQSGGEPLYRVNVGRLPRGPGLDDLKKRLAAAGFPAFEVLVPVARD